MCSCTRSIHHDTARTEPRRRWIRGDWQIASWLLSRVPVESNQPGRRIHFRPCPNGRSSTTFGAVSRPRADVLLLLGWDEFVAGVVLDRGGSRNHSDPVVIAR